MSKQRRTFTCPKCNEGYSLLVDPQEHPELVVKCPFCDTKQEINLSQQTVEEVYREDH
jgi:transcription elongation factor Elf1